MTVPIYLSQIRDGTVDLEDGLFSREPLLVFPAHLFFLIR